MSGKIEACEECSLMCHVMHRRNGDASSIATSFFKVMFGFNYNDFLLMPPNFARRIQYLNGQEVQLEDSSGEQWTVKVSKVDDSLAFVEGWNAFSKDHRLKVGEILVFHHINLSNPALFFVQIYGISGCPVFRLNDNGNSNKRSRTEGDFGAKVGPSYVNDNEVGSIGPGYFESGIKRSRTDGDFGAKPGPSHVNENEVGSDGPVYFDSGVKTLQDVPKTRQFEEPFFMIERDDGCIQEEYRSCLFDLSKYELPVGAKNSSRLGYHTEVSEINNDSVNLSGSLLKTLIEKPEENLKKIVVRTEEEAVRHKAENASITHPIECERSSCQDKTILKSPSEGQVLNSDSIKRLGHVSETISAKRAETSMNLLKMPKKAREQNAKEKGTTHLAETMKITKTEPAEMSGMHMKGVIHVESERLSRHDKAILKSPSEARVFGNDSLKLSGHALETFPSKTKETKINILQMPKNARGQNPMEKSTAHLAETVKAKTEPAEMSDMDVWKGLLHGTVEKGIKEGSRTFNPPIKDEIFGIVKDEPIDFDDAIPSNDPNASCSVVIDSDKHLELPIEFPSIVSARSGVDRRVVLIRGPDSRLWAVMYIQKFGIKCLNSGWKKFCKANGVQIGDECLFRREHNNQECIFRFNVVNRQQVNGKKV